MNDLATFAMKSRFKSTQMILSHVCMPNQNGAATVLEVVMEKNCRLNGRLMFDIKF